MEGCLCDRVEMVGIAVVRLAGCQTGHSGLWGCFVYRHTFVLTKYKCGYTAKMHEICTFTIPWLFSSPLFTCVHGLGCIVLSSDFQHETLKS